MRFTQMEIFQPDGFKGQNEVFFRKIGAIRVHALIHFAKF